MIIFEITDNFGKQVKLTDERWSHILARHPEMTEFIQEVQETIQDPTIVVNGSLSDEVKLYHKFFKTADAYVVVIVNQTKKFVVTSYLSESIKRGEIIWKKN